MKKRRIVTVAMAGMMALAAVGTFAGCDSAQGNVIKVAFAETGYGRTFLESWEAEYEALHPGVDVQLEGESGMTAEVETRLLTDTDVPDVFMVLQMGWQKLAAQDLLEPLDEVYAASFDETMTIESALNPKLKNYGKMTLRETHYYTIPWSDGATGIIYNYAMFEQYGWEVPTTVDELMGLCDQIKSDTNDAVRPFAMLGAYSNYIVDTWWAQYEGADNYTKFFQYASDPDGDGVYDYANDSTSIGYVQQGRVEALRTFENLFYDNVVWDTKNLVHGISSHTDAQTAFANGQAAMIVEGAWVETEAKNSIAPGFEMRMMPTPYLDGALTDENGDPIQVLASQAGDFMCIPKNANNVEGAKDFLKYVNSRKGCESYTKSLNGALRPFQYKADEIEGVTASEFMKSCWDIYQNSTVVYNYSNNPMSWSNKLGAWSGVGAPYDNILGGRYYEFLDYDANGNVVGNDVASYICQTCYDHVVEEWDEIVAEWQ